MAIGTPLKKKTDYKYDYEASQNYVVKETRYEFNRFSFGIGPAVDLNLLKKFTLTFNLGYGLELLDGEQVRTYENKEYNNTFQTVFSAGIGLYYKF